MRIEDSILQFRCAVKSNTFTTFSFAAWVLLLKKFRSCYASTRCCLRFGPSSFTPRALASAFVALGSSTARGEARWGAYPNEILLWRVSLESAEVRLRLGRALKDVRRDAALFQRFA